MSGLSALALALFSLLDARVPAAAQASLRPEPCRSEPFATSSLWARARPVEAERACRILARGLARLDRAPGEALELARSARFPADGTRAPALLEARALFGLGRFREAWRGFAPHFERGAPAVDDPRTLHDAGRSATIAGELERASEIYAMLVPRAVMLGSERVRRTVTIEAGALALGLGPDGLETALGYLTEARRSPAAGDRDLMLGLTALALDRGGRREQALTVASEASGPFELEELLSPSERARLSTPELSRLGDEKDTDLPSEAPARAPLGPGPVLPEGELHAAIALLADGRDARMWSAHLRAFLESPAGRGPWADHARRSLARGFAARSAR